MESEEILDLLERKIDVLTNLLKEASAEFDQALEKVSISEANFRAIFENAPEAICIIDMETGAILDFNPATLEVLGLSREELISMHISDFLEDGMRGTKGYFQEIIDRGLTSAEEMRFKRKGGAPIDTEVVCTVIDYQGKRCLAALMRDITERKSAQDALRKSEERFRDIATHIPDWIWEVDHNWSYTYSSIGAQNILGFSWEEIVGKPFWDRMPKDGHERLVRDLNEFQKNSRHFSLYESERVHRDGRIIHIESSGVPLLSESGVLLGYRGIHRDITQRKRLEELARYKELFENVSDPVFICDFHGRILEVNDVACNSLGYAREEFLKMSMKDMARSGQKDRLFETGEKVRSAETVQFELEMITAAGEIIPFEFHARSIGYGGETAVLGVARDLSMRKKLEQTLIETARLTALGEMASGVAHNFNNLLQMIMGVADAALSKLDAGKMRECREAIQRIQLASQRGAEVVRRIKDFTHLRDGEISDGDTFDLNELVHELVEFTMPLWKEPPDSRKYELNIKTCDEGFVRGRPSEICEVLLNLIKNGLEAMPKGGTLTISTDVQDEKVFLRVSDTGCGIPEENLQRVFQPFFTTKGLRSSGLGLSSSYGIVKKHQGEMSIESIVGHGTTLTIAIPRTRRVSEKERVEAKPGKCSKIKFLIIDDEINILRGIEMYFEDTEVEVITALTGMKGLDSWQQNDIDVVLCDLGMDDLTGWDIGREVKRYCLQRKVPKTPFLLYTGWDKELDPAKLKECGIDRVVVKPVKCEDLLHIVREVIAGKNLSCPVDCGASSHGASCDPTVGPM